MKLALKPNKHDIFIGSFIVVLIVSLVISLVSLKNSDDHYIYVKYDGQVVHQMDLYKDEVFVLEQEEYSELLGDLKLQLKMEKYLSLKIHVHTISVNMLVKFHIKDNL